MNSSTISGRLRTLYGRVHRGWSSAWDGFRRGLSRFRQAPVRWTWERVKALIRAAGRGLRWLVARPVRWLTALLTWVGNLTFRRVWTFTWRAALVVAVLLAVGFFAAVHWPHSQVPERRPADEVVYLDQGWGVGRNAPDRQLYYYTPQGTGNVLKNMRYSWFVNLEMPWGRQRFADPEHLLAYGFQVDNAPTPANPDQLPVGFTRHHDPRLGEDVLDISCAACHTGSLLVRRPDGTTVSIRIDGGQAMHAFTAANMPHFVPVLLASMTSTLVNPFKFNRFALNVLGAEHYREGKAALREEMGKTYRAILGMGINEKRHGLSPVDEGYGRTDALARIGNAVFGDHITPNNYRVGNAPVSYPPVWDIWKFDWVQYSGSVAQPMARNLGESLGVGATYSFFDRYRRPIPTEDRYDTTTRIHDLHRIELALRRLRPPVWPEDILGTVDRDKAIEGGLAFIRTCQGCHGPHPADERQVAVEMPGKLKDGLPHWRMKLLSVYDIGTDPTAAVNFVRNTYDLTPTGLTIEEVQAAVKSQLDQRTERELAYDYGDLHAVCAAPDRDVEAGTCDQWDASSKAASEATRRALDAINLKEASNGAGLNFIGLLMRQKLYDEAGLSASERQEYNGFGALDLPQVKMVYKARPLAGAWATAPYLHNGSVRTLYQLLSPQHERDRKFFIGRPEFDTAQLGLALADRKTGGFWLDTSVTGNANTGHEFRAGYTEWEEGSAPQYGVIGPAYSPAERYQIIEYIKVHLDDPPHSRLFAEVFAAIVERVAAAMPDAGNEGAIGENWPGDQACNLRQYLGNHAGAKGLSERSKADIEAIQDRLAVYFSMERAPGCGGSES